MHRLAIASRNACRISSRHGVKDFLTGGRSIPSQPSSGWFNHTQLRLFREVPNSGSSGTRGNGPDRTKVGLTALVIGAGGLGIWSKNRDEVPYSGRKRFVIFSNETMAKYGQGTLNQLKETYKYKMLPSNHQAVKTVKRVGRRIAEVSGLEGLEWEFYVVKDDRTNAFVVPGGKVFVFTGLFKVTPNEDALGSVLGHEVGHIVANHSGERLSKVAVTEGFIVVLSVLASLLGFGEDLGFARGMGKSLNKILLELPNSRDMEREADYIGLKLMSRACFDPKEMPKTFSRMKAVNEKKSLNGLSVYLSTHPTDDDRIKKQIEWLPEANKEVESSRCLSVRHELDAFLNH